MKRILSIISLASMSLLVLTGCSKGPKTPPHLVAEVDTLSIGYVPADNPVKTVSLGIRNDGGEPLVIKGFKTSCECLRAEAKDSIVKGHKVSSIDVTIDNPGSYDSVFVRTLGIYSNDSVSPKIVIVKGILKFPPVDE